MAYGEGNIDECIGALKATCRIGEADALVTILRPRRHCKARIFLSCCMRGVMGVDINVNDQIPRYPDMNPVHYRPVDGNFSGLTSKMFHFGVDPDQLGYQLRRVNRTVD